MLKTCIYTPGTIDKRARRDSPPREEVMPEMASKPVPQVCLRTLVQNFLCLLHFLTTGAYCSDQEKRRSRNLLLEEIRA